MNDPMRLTDSTGLCPDDGSAGIDQETGRYCTEAVVVTADRLPWTLHVTYARPNFVEATTMALPVSYWNATRSASRAPMIGRAVAAGVWLGVAGVATYKWLTFKDSEEIEIMLSSLSLENPGSLEGASREDVERLIPESLRKSPARTGKGTRYANPTANGEQVRIMDGDPNDPDLRKRGPYVRVAKNGKVSEPIPLNQ